MSIGPEAFQQIAKIEDLMIALKKCQALITEAKKDNEARVQASLGALAELKLRITESEKTWGKLIKKSFWKDCEGEVPDMEDRFDGTRFVVRFAEKAKKRRAAQNASKHAAVIDYLLEKGVKPADIPAAPRALLRLMSFPPRRWSHI